MRIAWFSPFPPVSTGVAAVSAELVAALRARGHLIDAYPEDKAHDFPWVHRQRPYELIVYQFGNSSHHDYEWPYALRYPGLVVLHDTRLHHARAALLLREQRRDDYRRELRANHPDLNPDVAELAVAGFDSRLYYEWPMVRGLVAASRLVAVHGEATRRELIEALSIPNATTPNSQSTPDAQDGQNAQGKEANSQYGGRIVSIRLGHGELVSPDREREARARVRETYGIAPDAVVFGVFGGLTPEKRLPQILAAFRAVRSYAPGAWLLLGGAEAPHFPLKDLFAAEDTDLLAAEYTEHTEYTEYTGAAEGVVVTGYIPDDELTDHIAAVDVSLNLRWPTARETSGPWLRALAAGKPTIVTDLVHLTDFASLDPRTWLVNTPSRTSGAVCVAVDILDEDHSLRLAMRRLAQDAALRETLGRAAREYWQREHSVDAMTDDYERVVRGDARPAPEHVAPVGDDKLRTLLRPFEIEIPFRVSPESAFNVVRASDASEPRERSAPAKRRARERAGESEGRSPSVEK